MARQGNSGPNPRSRRRITRLLPEPLQLPLGFSSPAVCEAGGENNGVDGSCACAADGIECDGVFLEQPIENAPCKGSE